MHDVVVVGAGPAGWALAQACADRGLDTAVVAPHPDAVWRPTYGLWIDQADALPPGAQVVAASAVSAGDRQLPRGYAVLDNTTVSHAPDTHVVAGTAVGLDHDLDHDTVLLRDGTRVAGRVVVDATGYRRVFTGGPPRGDRVEQTAYGVVVPAEVAEPLVAPGDAVFMRWGETTGWPTFLYAVPLPGGQVLLEETSLARRPGLPLTDLAERLDRRLAAAGITVPASAPVERVRFPVDVPPGRGRGAVVAFGVAAGMTHPATGYSVGEALTTAPAVAAAIADELPRGGPRAAAAARAVVWSPAARAVRRLREWGLRALLAMPPERVPEFFDVFFTVPPDLQRAYLSGRADLRGTTAAMTAVFAAAPWRLRGALVTGGWSGRRPVAAGGSAQHR